MTGTTAVRIVPLVPFVLFVLFVPFVPIVPKFPHYSLLITLSSPSRLSKLYTAVDPHVGAWSVVLPIPTTLPLLGMTKKILLITHY